MAKILIIDDEKLINDSLARIFKEMNHQVIQAFMLGKGVDMAMSENPDIVFLDVRLPDGNGIHKLPEIKAASSSPEVIIITGYADPDSAELAIKSNAWDYLKKPASMGAIKLVLNRALQYRSERDVAMSQAGSKSVKREGIIGNSSEILACLDILARSAESNSNILISGETGTGKELFSRAIHENSQRAKNDFVIVDCASLPENLIENLLFGHAKGAFTGADKKQEGLVKQADSGTLFLDEIGELPLATQKSFLRVLQERRFRPLGGSQEIKSDFRLVSATNRNLDEMVKEGKFRNDLLFRIRSVSINLPPLKKRIEDIKELTVSYLMKLCESHNIGMKGFSPDFMEALNAYEWPGNVRELYATLDWAIARAFYDPTMFPQHLPPQIRVCLARSSFDGESVEETMAPAPLSANVSPDEDRAGTLVSQIIQDFESIDTLPKWHDFRISVIAEAESEYLKSLYVKSDKNIQKAAGLSGLSQPRLYQLYRKYRIANN
ncbi:sigma-54 dependent transcriptional regulator [Desulfobacterales bacterium HSG16]|nr:sigma-54 dependent transcriptional regulator [Desulfobacterales bacterium HSG16]